MPTRAAVLALLVATSSLQAGCAEPAPDECLPLVTIEATPLILSSGDQIQLEVDVRDMTLLEPGEPAEGDYGENCAGHYKVHVDDADDPAVLEGIAEEAIFPVEAPVGDHELIVRLYDPQDVPLIPEIRDSVEFRIE